MTVRGQGRSLQHGASKYHGGRSVYTPRSAISATLREKSLAKGFLLENVSTDALYPAFYLKKKYLQMCSLGKIGTEKMIIPGNPKDLGNVYTAKVWHG